MKNILKRLLLAVLVIFLFSSCGNKSKEEELKPKKYEKLIIGKQRGYNKNLFVLDYYIKYNKTNRLW